MVKSNTAHDQSGSTLAAAAAAAVRRCPVCGKTDDLLRCSRCKSEWYCNETHQRDHWAQHKLVCQHRDEPPPPPPPAAPPAGVSMSGVKSEFGLGYSNGSAGAGSSSATAGSDDVVEVETLVSLDCPLTIERLVLPAQGKYCTHPQCFELGVRSPSPRCLS